ncbi:MAG: D-hexose-6-phosphate mutarotase [Nevskiales bacterium]
MQLTPGEGGLQHLLLTAADGARAEIYQHGAHITSWVPAGGSERLYLSRKAQFKSGAAIRGGVPVIFPQFAGEGPLPKHGFARGLPWRLVAASQPGQGPATAVFGLDDDDATRAIWPHSFKAELRVTLGGAALETVLSVENTGKSEISFTAALHTYLRVAEIGAVRLHGLEGLHYRDTAQGGIAAVESVDRLCIEGEVDRIYFNAPARLELSGAPGCLHIESAGFADAVVWNPGSERGAALSDLDQEGYRNFLCVEAAAIGVPVKLAPGARWSGMQKLVQD